MHCESEVVDLDQIKCHLVIEFEFRVFVGAFEDVFEQVAVCGKQTGILVHELRVTLELCSQTSSPVDDRGR